MVDAGRFSHARFAGADNTGVEQLCRNLAYEVVNPVSGAADLNDVMVPVIERLRSGGHDLWSFDQDTDVEAWSADWSRPSAGPSLTVEVRLPLFVRISWGRPGPHVVAEADATTLDTIQSGAIEPI